MAISLKPTPDDADRVAARNLQLVERAAAALAPIRHIANAYGYKRVRTLDIDRQLARAAFAAHAQPHRDMADKLAEALRDVIPALNRLDAYDINMYADEITDAVQALAEYEASR